MQQNPHHLCILISLSIPYPPFPRGRRLTLTLILTLTLKFFPVDRLPGQRVSYKAHDEIEGAVHPHDAFPTTAREQRHRLIEHQFPFKHARAPHDLSLKPGAQVMLLANLDLSHRKGDMNLVNGTKGVVVGLAPLDVVLRHAIDAATGRSLAQSWREGRELGGGDAGDRGKTNETWEMVVHLPPTGDPIGDGPGVVRGGTRPNPNPGYPNPNPNPNLPGDDKDLPMIQGSIISSDRDEIRWLLDFMHGSPAKTELARRLFPAIPLVKWLNGRCQWVTPKVFVNDYGALGFASRTMLPLRLCWSLTVHKSQGATLDLVEVRYREIKG
jgi:hypothetical protein